MKIALPVTSDGMTDSHFGHCEYFDIYAVTTGNEIESVRRIPSADGCGCKSGIASVLASEGVTVMLAGGIGSGAINVLNNSGIKVIRGCEGKPEQLVNLYLSGRLSDSGESCRQHEHHHSHGGNHSCSNN